MELSIHKGLIYIEARLFVMSIIFRQWFSELLIAATFNTFYYFFINCKIHEYHLSILLYNFLIPLLQLFLFEKSPEKWRRFFRFYSFSRTTSIST